MDNSFNMEIKKYLFILLILLIFGFAGVAKADTINLLPNATGTYTNLWSFPGGVNWQVMSDDDDTTGVYWPGPNDMIDSYELQDFSGIGTINSVVLHARVGTAGECDQFAHFFLLGNGNFVDTGIQTIPGTGELNDYAFTLDNPFGGSWTITDLNNVEAGLGLASPNCYNAKATKIWLAVDYTPTITSPVIPPDFATSVFAYVGSFFSDLSKPNYILIGIALALFIIEFVVALF